MGIADPAERAVPDLSVVCAIVDRFEGLTFEHQRGIGEINPVLGQVLPPLALAPLEPAGHGTM